MTTEYEYLSAEELYVEVHHIRGNFTLFEYEDNGQWREVDVWQYRRMDDAYWQVLFDIYASMSPELAATFDPHDPEMSSFRVKRFPELEKEMLDVTYHPSVESWKIDPTAVKAHFTKDKN